jgi:hypothetical protein
MTGESICSCSNVRTSGGHLQDPLNLQKEMIVATDIWPLLISYFGEVFFKKENFIKTLFLL